MPRTVLVTGANGFTASHLCRKLIERGDHVRGLVRPTSDLRTLKGLDVELVYGYLAEDDLPAGGFRGVEVVYHLAAAYRKEGVPRQHFFDVNLKGTQSMLKAALTAGVAQFVHCSTVGVHGNIASPPATETAPYDPGDPYQESKLQGEQCVLTYFQHHQLPTVIVRPVGIYGPGDTRFLKLFRSIDRGWFCMLGSGNVLYHLTYVDDLVDGMILAGERGEAVGQTFILASDEYLTLRQLIQKIAEVLGRPVPRWRLPLWPFMLAGVICQKTFPRFGLEPPLYPRRLDFFAKDRAFDNSKAKRLLGFQPRVDLRTGLALTADWYRQEGYLQPAVVSRV